MNTTPPSLFDWAGGEPAFKRLFARFYERVAADPVLAPIFADMNPQHAAHVADFVSEVFGGPPRYSEDHGGHVAMIRKHLSRSLNHSQSRSLNHSQRKAWVSLLLDCADEVGLPDDPEFRSAFVGYLEWGSRLAVINSQPNASVEGEAPMPHWDWGAAKGPYIP